MEEPLFSALGKWLIILGAAAIVLGLLLMLGDRLPFLGRLPGDIIIRRKNFSFYFPITTLILLNLALWLVIWLFHKFKG